MDTIPIQETENLNLEHRVKLLTVKALNKCSSTSRGQTMKDAAKLLGISERTLYRHIVQFEIKCHFS
jgi:transcriptional regulator of acetoin/glycerol metabolism